MALKAPTLAPPQLHPSWQQSQVRDFLFLSLIPITHRELSGFLSGRPSAGAGHRSRPAAPEGTQGLSKGTCGSGKSQSQISAWSVGRRGMKGRVGIGTLCSLCPPKLVPGQNEWQVLRLVGAIGDMKSGPPTPSPKLCQECERQWNSVPIHRGPCCVFAGVELGAGSALLT